MFLCLWYIISLLQFNSPIGIALIAASLNSSTGDCIIGGNSDGIKVFTKNEVDADVTTDVSGAPCSCSIGGCRRNDCDDGDFAWANRSPGMILRVEFNVSVLQFSTIFDAATNKGTLGAWMCIFGLTWFNNGSEFCISGGCDTSIDWFRWTFSNGAFNWALFTLIPGCAVPDDCGENEWYSPDGFLRALKVNN